MIKVFESFAGIGTQNMALKRLKEDYGLEYEVIGISEVDEYAIKSYDAIHTNKGTTFEANEKEMREYLEKLNIPLLKNGKRKSLKGKNLKDFYNANKRAKNYGDISKINAKDLPKIDLFTWSYPCQSISVAGKQEGLTKGSGTTSSLAWESLRIIKDIRPKMLLMENVKNLVSKKFIKDFELIIKELENMGYKNYWKILNGKDFGMPQNRERVFMVSLLDGGEFNFPEGFELKKRLKDILEYNVDEKYYLTNDKADILVNKLLEKYDLEDVSFADGSINNPKIKDVSNTITARYDAGIQNKPSMGLVVVERLLGLYDKESSTHQSTSVYNINGISPTLSTVSGGGIQPHIVIKNLNNYRIRKLTPLECFRLMGIDDDDFDKAQSVNSNAQLYKQAGNAIVVNVLEEIFKKLFELDLKRN